MVASTQATFSQAFLELKCSGALCIGLKLKCHASVGDTTAIHGSGCIAARSTLVWWWHHVAILGLMPMMSRLEGSSYRQASLSLLDGNMAEGPREIDHEGVGMFIHLLLWFEWSYNFELTYSLFWKCPSLSWGYPRKHRHQNSRTNLPICLTHSFIDHWDSFILKK